MVDRKEIISDLDKVINKIGNDRDLQAAKGLILVVAASMKGGDEKEFFMDLAGPMARSAERVMKNHKDLKNKLHN
jgi:hypothetical protein